VLFNARPFSLLFAFPRGATGQKKIITYFIRLERAARLSFAGALSDL
jgi:hypothetical protein